MSQTVIHVKCLGGCGVQAVTIKPAMPEDQAIDYCAILDGSSSMYVSDPRKDESSMIGRCVTCGGLIEASVGA